MPGRILDTNAQKGTHSFQINDIRKPRRSAAPDFLRFAPIAWSVELTGFKHRN